MLLLVDSAPEVQLLHVRERPGAGQGGEASQVRRQHHSNLSTRQQRPSCR